VASGTGKDVIALEDAPRKPTMIEQVMPLATCASCKHYSDCRENTGWHMEDWCKEAQRLSDLRAEKKRIRVKLPSRWLDEEPPVQWALHRAIWELGQELDQLIKECGDIPPEQPHAACGED